MHVFPCFSLKNKKKWMKKRFKHVIIAMKQLIPKGLDTGDLLIIVLLLLMAGDCEEEKNNALLTLALYLFL